MFFFFFYAGYIQYAGNLQRTGNSDSTFRHTNVSDSVAWSTSAAHLTYPTDRAPAPKAGSDRPAQLPLRLPFTSLVSARSVLQPRRPSFLEGVVFPTSSLTLPGLSSLLSLPLKKPLNSKTQLKRHLLCTSPGDWLPGVIPGLPDCIVRGEVVNILGSEGHVVCCNLSSCGTKVATDNMKMVSVAVCP